MLKIGRVPLELCALAAATLVIAGWLGQSGRFPQLFSRQQQCIVLPLGGGFDDTKHIERAIRSCSASSVITLPAPYVYSIQSVLTTRLERQKLEILGTLQFSDNITYWRENCKPVGFQHQCAAWILTGDDFEVDGGPWGGMHGNGQTWMSFSAGESNTPGRPISLWINEAHDGVLRNFRFIQPQFWAVMMTDSANLLLDHITVWAENTDPRAATSTGPNKDKWVQNLDGANTYRSNNITISNWVYQGGDDLVAIKGNSSNILVENVTGYGGNGIAIGSLGQYPGVFDIVEDVMIRNVTELYPSRHTPISSGIYFKSWVGVETGVAPNGGGGGGGIVRNVTASDFVLHNVTLPVYVESCLTYLETDVSSACNTSTLGYHNITLRNFTGTTNGTDSQGIGPLTNTEVVRLQCSVRGPCETFTFEGFNIKPPARLGPPTFILENVHHITGL